MKPPLHGQLIQHAPFGYAHLEIIFDAADAPLDYRILESNGAFERLTGFATGQLTGRSVHDVLPGIKKEALDKVYKSNAPLSFAISYENNYNTGHLEVDAFPADQGLSIVTRDITERKQAEDALEKRLFALTQPVEIHERVSFNDLFDLADIQRIQDDFANATNVASIITYPDGQPITRSSNFTRLCSEIIRKTDKGLQNCFCSDAALGKPNRHGATVKPCLSAGLWDAGAAITVGGHHIANWLIGQVRDENQNVAEIRAYAKTIGADEEAMVEAFFEVPRMSRQQFEKVARALFTIASQLSDAAYHNMQQARYITEKKKAEDMILKNERLFAAINTRLINLGPDYASNVKSLTALCGELLDATCALFNRLDDNMLCSIGQWNTPPDFDPVDKPDGHICFDVIRRNKRETLLVRDLPSTEYFHTDPNVSRYALKTYAGYPVFSGGEAIGSLCVVFQDDRVLDETDLGILSIISSALASEEQRYRDSKALQDSDRQLMELSTLLRLMADNMPDMLWAKNLKKEYVFANKALCQKLLNASDTAEPLGKTDIFFALREREKHPDNPQWHTFGEICRDSDSITLQEMKSMQFDEFGNVKGEFLYLDVHKAPLYNDEGQLIGIVGSARDVTGAKAVEHELIKLSQAVKQSPASVIITDLNGTIEYVNPRFTEVTGYTSEETIGKNPKMLQSGLHDSDFYNKLWETISTGKEWRGELKNKKKSGELFWESASIYPILNDKGETTHYLSVKEDITEKKKAEQELIVAKEKAEESNRLKTAFINNISHEIRTPLYGIMGFGELITQEGLSQSDKQDFYNSLQISSNRLQQTITDIMDISEIKSGAIKTDHGDVHIGQAINTLTELTQYACSKRNILVAAAIPDTHEDLILTTDGRLFEKIMRQLLSNAEKFTNSGRITVGYELEGEWVRFFVKDTGKGIAAENHEMIFDPFMQEDISVTRGHEGSGLGLSIAKGLVELLGGKIWVQSKKGEGASFFFTLPYKPAIISPEIESSSAHKAVAANNLILIAEDDDSNYELIKTVIQNAGYSSLHALNGAEAIEFCHNYPEIALVLMDIKMPVMNGMEATTKIKSLRPGLPVIAITAHAQTGDRERVMEAGCDAYLAKPVKSKELNAMIVKMLHR